MTGSAKETLSKVFTTLAEQLQQEGFTKEELISLVAEREESIPATAFANKLTPLETLARHLETRPETWSLLGRPTSAVKQALKNSYKKRTNPLSITETKHHIPLKTFSDKKYSFLEHICLFLKTRHLRNKEIADLIGKDQRTVWTALERAREKGGSK